MVWHHMLSLSCDCHVTLLVIVMWHCCLLSAAPWCDVGAGRHLLPDARPIRRSRRKAVRGERRYGCGFPVGLLAFLLEECCLLRSTCGSWRSVALLFARGVVLLEGCGLLGSIFTLFEGGVVLLEFLLEGCGLLTFILEGCGIWGQIRWCGDQIHWS